MTYLGIVLGYIISIQRHITREIYELKSEPHSEVNVYGIINFVARRMIELQCVSHPNKEILSLEYFF